MAVKFSLWKPAVHIFSIFTPPFIKVVALGIFGCLNHRSTAKPIPTSHPPCESGPCAQWPQHWQESSRCHHLLYQVKMVKMSKCRTSLGSCDSVYKLETWMRIRRGSYIHQTSTSRIKNAYYAYISRHISWVKIQPSGYIFYQLQSLSHAHSPDSTHTSIGWFDYIVYTSMNTHIYPWRKPIKPTDTSHA